jgi:quercetin dioxygenase-like cupin family protein
VGPDPVDLGAIEGDGGVVWSISPEGFHTNLVVFTPGQSIGAHRNDAVDVLIVVLAGSATVTVDGRDIDVGATGAVLVPKGAVRSVASGPTGVRYLSVHGPKPGLTIGARRPASG